MEKTNNCVLFLILFSFKVRSGHFMGLAIRYIKCENDERWSSSSFSMFVLNYLHENTNTTYRQQCTYGPKSKGTRSLVKLTKTC